MRQPLEDFLIVNYGLSTPRITRRLETKGERAAFVVDAREGKFTLKVSYPGRPEEQVRRETDLLAHLALAGFPAPVPCPAKNGALYLPFQERFAYIYPWIEGRRPRPSLSFFNKLGTLLARLHTIRTDTARFASGYTPLSVLSEVREFLLGIRDPQLQPYAAELIAEIQAFPDFSGLPQTLIHTDPYTCNILEGRDGQLFLIDWDDSGTAAALLDVGYVLAHHCAFVRGDPAAADFTQPGQVAWRGDWAAAFLRTYQSARPLTPREVELLPYSVLFNLLMYVQDWEKNQIVAENYLRIRFFKENPNLIPAQKIPTPIREGASPSSRPRIPE